MISLSLTYVGQTESILKDWQDPSLLLHYAKYSRASYGTKIMFIHPGKYFCNLRNILARLVCPCSRPPYVRGDTCCSCNFAIWSAISSKGLGEILHVSYENDVGLTPNAVDFDEQKQSVVISIRGSASLSDVITDGLANPSSMWDKLSQWQRREIGENSSWSTFEGKLNRMIH